MICTLMLVTYIVSPYLEVTSKRCFWMQSMGLLILNYILVVFFRSFLALFYIWLGYQSVSIFQKLNGKVKKEIIGVAILLGVGIIFLPYTQTIEIHYLKLGKRIYSFISTICFSFGFLLLFQIMENKPIKWLAFLGTNSLWIMCTHKDFGIPNWCIQVGDFFVSISPRAKNYVFWITAFGTLLLVEIGLSIFFNKIAIWNKQMHCSGRGG